MRQEPGEGCGVQAGAGRPEVQVAAEDALGCELHRSAGGERDARAFGEFGGDLYRGVPGPDHHQPAAGEGGRAAVVGSVQHLPGELVQTRQLRLVRSAEGAGGRDDGPRPESAAAFEDHVECGSVASYGGDALTGADVGVHAVAVGGEVGDDLIAVRVAVAVGAGERHSGQGAVPGGREQREAVVVVRPGPDGLVAGFEQSGAQASGG